MRDCANVEVRDLLPELLHERLHERLGERDRERVLAHVGSCADCTDELALLRATVAVSTAEAPRVDPALIARQVLARLHAPPAPSHVTPTIASAPHAIPLRPRRPTWGRGTLRAAAAALIMVVGSGIVLYERGATANRVTSPSPALVPSSGQTASPSRPVAVATPAAPAIAESVPGAPARAGARPAAQSALGASFDDLSDDELAAVLDAVEATDRGPAADPAPTPAIITSGDVL